MAHDDDVMPEGFEEDHADCAEEHCRVAEQMTKDGAVTLRGLRMAGFTDDQVILAAAAAVDEWTDVHNGGKVCHHIDKALKAIAWMIGVVLSMRNSKEGADA